MAFRRLSAEVSGILGPVEALAATVERRRRVIEGGSQPGALGLLDRAHELARAKLEEALARSMRPSLPVQPPPAGGPLLRPPGSEEAP